MAFTSCIAAIFKQFLLFQDADDVAPERCIGIFFRLFGNEQKRTSGRNAAFCRAERFAKQSLDPVPLHALAVLLPHADSHFHGVGGKIDDGQRAAMRALSRFEDFQKVLLLFEAQILHTRDVLSGNVLSALISSSLEHLSAAGGRHSLAEAVYLALLSLLGLICPFHDFSPILFCGFRLII